MDARHVRANRAGRPRRGRGAGRVLCAAVLSVALAGCDEVLQPERTTVYGEEKALGNGSARTYLVMEGTAPVELGIVMTEAALTGLPAGAGTLDDGHPPVFETLLPLPAGNPTPYRLVELNWNPVGHPPGAYSTAHFDFHFYTMTLEERNRIDPADPAFEQKANRLPASEYMPAGYVPVPGAVPRMGVHWVDPTSPEFQGKPFTRSFLYGSWDGKTTFVEPMVTLKYLTDKPALRGVPIPTPAKYDPSGWYPTSQTIEWDGARKEYRIGLGGFVRH